MKSIQVTKTTHDQLFDKINSKHKTMNAVIMQLIEDEDIARHTLEILNDPELMQQLKESENDYQKGNCVPLSELINQLNEKRN